MKILNEELRKKFEDRKSDKGSSWTSWIVKIIILIAAILLIRYFSSLHVAFFTDIFRSSDNAEEVGNNLQ